MICRYVAWTVLQDQFVPCDRTARARNLLFLGRRPGVSAPGRQEKYQAAFPVIDLNCWSKVFLETGVSAGKVYFSGESLEPVMQDRLAGTLLPDDDEVARRRGRSGRVTVRFSAVVKFGPGFHFFPDRLPDLLLAQPLSPLPYSNEHLQPGEDFFRVEHGGCTDGGWMAVIAELLRVFARPDCRGRGRKRRALQGPERQGQNQGCAGFPRPPASVLDGNSRIRLPSSRMPASAQYFMAAILSISRDPFVHPLEQGFGKGLDAYLDGGEPAPLIKSVGLTAC